MGEDTGAESGRGRGRGGQKGPGARKAFVGAGKHVTGESVGVRAWCCKEGCDDVTDSHQDPFRPP